MRGVSPEVAAEADEITRIVRQCAEEARNLARGLCPVAMENGGLVAALHALTAGVTGRSQSALHWNATTTHSEGRQCGNQSLPDRPGSGFQCDQTWKSKIGPDSTGGRDGKITLQVRDDGKGFPAKPKQTGMGLHTMRYRATMIGGSLDVRPSRPRGTVVTVLLPDQRLSSIKAKQKPAKTKILLVEDHQIVRQGIARIINQEPDMEVCGEAGDAREALSADREAQARPRDHGHFDGGMNGIEFLKHLKRDIPNCLSWCSRCTMKRIYAERALRAGALALCDEKGEQRRSNDGDSQGAGRASIHVSEKVGGGIFQKFLNTKRSGESPLPAQRPRTGSLRVAGPRRGSKEIAAELHLSVKTVDTHRTHIKEKLDLHNVRELIQHAVQWVERENNAV